MITKESCHRIASFAWIVLGIALCLGSVQLGLGTMSSPESGLLPFITGALLGACGIVLVLLDMRKPPAGRGTSVEASGKMFGKKGGLSLAALFLYAFLMEPLGFILSTFMVLFLLFKIMEPRKWVTPIFISVTAVIVGYLVFCVWLRVNFPKGILGLG